MEILETLKNIDGDLLLKRLENNEASTTISDLKTIANKKLQARITASKKAFEDSLTQGKENE